MPSAIGFGTQRPKRIRKWDSRSGRPFQSGLSSSNNTADYRIPLPAAPLKDHDRERARHDPEIFGNSLAAEVLEIVLHLRPNVFEAGIVAMVDLRPSGDPGLCALT